MVKKITEKNFNFINPVVEAAKWSLERLKKQNKKDKEYLKSLRIEEW
ncbi:hypothetical protein LCGC14_1588620, partial [marine sediment metagenome]